MSKGFKIEAVDWHRNGVGGEGFSVAIVDDKEEGQRFLVIDFNPEYKYVEPEDRDEDYDRHQVYGYTAVLDIDLAQQGNIHMFPVGTSKGGNAWRGDRLGDKYRQAINDARDAQYEAKMGARR